MPTGRAGEARRDRMAAAGGLRLSLQYHFMRQFRARMVRNAPKRDGPAGRPKHSWSDGIVWRLKETR